MSIAASRVHMLACAESEGAGAKFTAQAAVRSGVSLIELIAVTLIIAIIAALAIPKFANSRDRFDVEASARRLAASLDYARRHAMCSGATRSVFFSPAIGTVSIPSVPDINGGLGTVVDLPALGYASTFVTSFPDDAVSFSVHGTASSSGDVTVSLGGWSKTVSVLAPTGRVSVGD